MFIVRACYRLLLRALPREMRREHGREMEEIFVDRLRSAKAAGGWGRRPATAARAVVDILSTARESRRTAPPDGW
jgi:hypothetical protein